ncbi:hypothetical protein FH972_026911 [Carpinus fangiana]|uniref:Ribonuclease H n=1 Tax=Carpinus fangiana TaxID=176857 RepID=A0A5N6L5S5_9ROSI|nr:hypothetical protein FH972_026911 [Carpinus fangiana]
MGDVPLTAASRSIVAGAKRKRDQPKFYAVHAGVRPGVYQSWEDCLIQVKGFKNALYKSFSSISEAQDFVNIGPTKKVSGGTSKFYAVRGGRLPGVYTDWPTVQNLIQGWKGVKQKSFPSRFEAEAFVRGESLVFSDASEEAKKKRSRKSTVFDDTAGEKIDESAAPGTGPMPSIAQDGFDPNIKLGQTTGNLEYKAPEERNRYKMQAKGLAEHGTLFIYTDGSSLDSNKRDRNLSEALPGPRQTNQRAELTAIKRALDLAPLDRDVEIYSDSNYSIKCVTEWFRTWRRNGWLNAAKKAVENRDIIEDILSKIDERNMARSKTEFQWLKGHADDPGNVAADTLAVSGAREARANINGAYYAPPSRNQVTIPESCTPLHGDMSRHASLQRSLRAPDLNNEFNDFTPFQSAYSPQPSVFADTRWIMLFRCGRECLLLYHFTPPSAALTSPNGTQICKDIPWYCTPPRISAFHLICVTNLSVFVLNVD